MKKINGVILSVPFRIHSFVTEFGKMYDKKENHNFGGGLGFSVATDNFMKIKKTDRRVIRAPYKKVIGKYIDVFKKMYSYTGDFFVELEKGFPEHNGYGSTIVIATVVCVGINILLGNKCSKTELNTIIFENYCEEDLKGMCVEALTSGVGGLVMLFGGLIYMDNGNAFIRTEFSSNQKVVLFTTFQNESDKVYDVYDEFELTEQYIEADIRDRDKKMKIIQNSLIPSMLRRDFGEVAKANDLLNEIGSGLVDCKQFKYDKQERLFSHIRQIGASLVGISSAGPTAYALVEADMDQVVVDLLVKEGIDRETIKVHNLDNRGIYVLKYIMD